MPNEPPTPEELAADPGLLRRWIEGGHAEKYPTGCPGFCMDCVRRLGIQLVTCPCCGNKSVPLRDGKLEPHDRKVGGRRNYRARPQLCEGSGRKP